MVNTGSDVEKALGNFNIEEFFIDLNDENEWHQAYCNENIAMDLASAISQITYYFEEWIRTIDVYKVNPIKNFTNLININKDHFLTFNYTPTLEKLYNAKYICHIHGIQGKTLYFGHGNYKYPYGYFIDHYVGSENEICKLHSLLQKNTDLILEQNIAFFKELKDIDKIYSYGFSFAEVDLIYISEICHRIPTKKVTWYLNDYDDFAKRNTFKSIIQACGFNGKFQDFHI